jgi:hypothetical protein
LLNQARYSLELNQIEESVNLYLTVLNSAINTFPSMRFLELFDQVVMTLNAKAKQLIGLEKMSQTEYILENLLHLT